MATLSVNVDHIATLRQARGGTEPDPVAGAVLAELAGAEGIIAHLREDRRHVQDRDVKLLRETIQTRLNFEMAATPEMLGIAADLKPEMATLVPEKRQELTTEGGLNVAGAKDHVGSAVSTLQKAGILVSLFVDAEEEQINAARDIEAEYIEIHTGHYADAKSKSEVDRLFNKICAGVRQARELGLKVNLGHGLDYINIKRFKGLEGVDEYAIGHSIISRAVLVGLDRAVREMVDLVREL